jgi:uncharacterized protein with HEPN domain
MKPLNRDNRILEHIVAYCDQIKMAIDQFGSSFSTFSGNPVYQNAVCMCILQIGELVANLSDDFKERHPTIPWRQIKLMRNVVAHRYGSVDYTVVWDVVEHDIPTLRAYCQSVLDAVP